MSSGNIAYLILVGCGFGAFMVALAYGYIASSLADRRASKTPVQHTAEPVRRAA